MYNRPEELTEAERIEQDYIAALDSVRRINTVIEKGQKYGDPKDTVDRNVRHLELMVAKDFWQGQDLTPLRDAITAGKKYVSS